MTTTLVAPTPSRTVQTGLKVTRSRVIRSEWIKLLSLRSTLIALGAAFVTVIGFGMLFAAFRTGQVGSPGNGGPGGPDGDPTSLSLSGVMLGQLIIGSLGVMITAGEYTTGMIRSSLAAVPRRLPVLWAKVIVFAVTTFVLMLAAAFVAFLAGQAILSGGGAASASLSDPGVIRAIFGAAIDLTGIGVIGLALGALLRSTAGAVSTLFGLILLLPGLAPLLPASLSDNLVPNLPSNAIQSFMAVQQAPGTLAPWTGLAVFAAYIVVLTAGAAVLLKRRDA
jgi:hypothetical protein